MRRLVLAGLVGILMLSSAYTSNTPTYEDVLSQLADTFHVSTNDKYTLVVFWHAGIPESRLLIPKVKDVYDDYKEREYAFGQNGLNLLYVSIDEFRSPMAKAWKSMDMGDTPYIWDKEKTFSTALETTRPELVLLDSRGFICIRTTILYDMCVYLDKMSDSEWANLGKDKYNKW